VLKLQGSSKHRKHTRLPQFNGSNDDVYNYYKKKQSIVSINKRKSDGCQDVDDFTTGTYIYLLQYCSERSGLQNTYLHFVLIDTYCSCPFDVCLCLLSAVSKRPTMVGIITYVRLLLNLPQQSYWDTNNIDITMMLCTINALKCTARTKKWELTQLRYNGLENWKQLTISVPGDGRDGYDSTIVDDDRLGRGGVGTTHCCQTW